MRTLLARNGSITPALVKHFEDRRLERSAARLVMRRGPPFDDPRLHPVAKKLARGEKARGTRADDEALGIGPRVGLLRFPATFRLPPKFL